MPANPAVSRRPILLVLVVAVLIGGQGIGERLVHLTGGSNEQASYTSLAYADPEQAANGLQLQGDVTFVITNMTGTDRTYRWNTTIDDKVSASGSVVTAANESASVTVPLRRTGHLVFHVDGLPQELTGTIRSDGDAPSKEAAR